jgi:predicted ABC-type ATPase
MQYFTNLTLKELRATPRYKLLIKFANKKEITYHAHHARIKLGSCSKSDLVRILMDPFYIGQILDRRPYIIITNGPTGSGKNGLIQKVIDKYQLVPTYRRILIDDIVEQSQEYKSRVTAIVNRECRGETRELCTNLETKMNLLDETIRSEFNDAYFSVRRGYYCGINNTATCDEYNDLLLDNAIKQQDNIVFETTGTAYAKWLINKVQNDAKERYLIIYAFTLLDFCTNIDRNKLRAGDQMKIFLSEPDKNNAPRLPDIREIPFSNTTRLIQENLWDLIERKIDGTLDKSIDHLVVFNNSDHTIDVLYDSGDIVPMSDLTKVIEKIKNVQNIRSCPDDNF